MRDPLGDPGPLLDRLYAYVAYRIGAGPRAEDVTSEALERALRYRHSYDPALGTPIQWLIGIARRLLAEGGDDLPLGEGDELAAPGFEDAAVERVDLQRALARIPERDRELLALRHGAGLRSKEIAKLLDSTPAAVDVAVHRALARLRDAYEVPGTRKKTPPAPVLPVHPPSERTDG
jgi:RNA polymerase sigma-70 factor (ECF subfamily)